MQHECREKAEGGEQTSERMIAGECFGDHRVRHHSQDRASRNGGHERDRRSGRGSQKNEPHERRNPEAAAIVPHTPNT